MKNIRSTVPIWKRLELVNEFRGKKLVLQASSKLLLTPIGSIAIALAKPLPHVLNK